MTNNLSSSQRYKITFVLIALNVAVYVYTSIAGGNWLITSGAKLTGM